MVGRTQKHIIEIIYLPLEHHKNQTYIVLKYSIIGHQNTKQLSLYSIFLNHANHKIVLLLNTYNCCHSLMLLPALPTSLPSHSTIYLWGIKTL
jgi:hypothetical protein